MPRSLQSGSGGMRRAFESASTGEWTGVLSFKRKIYRIRLRRSPRAIPPKKNANPHAGGGLAGGGCALSLETHSTSISLLKLNTPVHSPVDADSLAAPIPPRFCSCLCAVSLRMQSFGSLLGARIPQSESQWPAMILARKSCGFQSESQRPARIWGSEI